MLRALSVCLTLMLCVGCGKPEAEKIGTIINTPGKYSLNGVSVGSVEVKRAQNNDLRLTVFTKTGSTSPDVDLAKRWFVFPENADRLWVCFGTDDLVLMEFGEKKETSRSILKDRSLVSEIPQKVLSKIPESLKAKMNANPENTTGAK